MSKKEKVEKTEKAPKLKSSTQQRVELAEKTLDYLQNTLKVPDEEISKVLSRAFTIVRKSMK